MGSQSGVAREAGECQESEGQAASTRSWGGRVLGHTGRRIALGRDRPVREKGLNLLGSTQIGHGVSRVDEVSWLLAESGSKVEGMIVRRETRRWRTSVIR